MNEPRYSLPAICLHWVHAALLLGLIWLGWTMVDLPKGAERSAAYGLHKSLGLLALGLAALRLFWRWRNPPPPLPGSGWQKELASLTQRGMYFFFLILPLAGYLASSFTPYAIKFFGLELPRLAASDESLNSLFKLLHWSSAWGLLSLILLHLAGVALHLWRRDGLMKRMLPAFLSRK